MPLSHGEYFLTPLGLICHFLHFCQPVELLLRAVCSKKQKLAASDLDREVKQAEGGEGLGVQ